VDRGFEYVKEIRRMYETGEALPQMTMQLFIWGILSRGAGPMAQEAAYIDIINDAMPFVEKALREPLTLLDVNNWTAQIAGRMPTIKKEVNGKIVNVPDPDYTGEITGSVFANSPAKNSNDEYKRCWAFGFCDVSVCWELKQNSNRHDP
jgi:hypothetical protein